METIAKLIQKKDAEELREYLSIHPQLVYTLNEHSLSPLMIAAYHRFDEAVDMISSMMERMTVYEASAAGNLHELKRNLNEHPDLLDKYAVDGFTALGLACFFGKKDVAGYLLERHADVNKASDNAFHVAPLHSAVAGNYAEIAGMLLKNGAEPDLPQQMGIRPVHSAAHNGSIAVLKLLIEHGADTDAKDDNGKSAAMYAKEAGHIEIYQILTQTEK